MRNLVEFIFDIRDNYPEKFKKFSSNLDANEINLIKQANDINTIINHELYLSITDSVNHFIADHKNHLKEYDHKRLGGDFLVHPPDGVFYAKLYECLGWYFWEEFELEDNGLYNSLDEALRDLDSPIS